MKTNHDLLQQEFHDDSYCVSIRPPRQNKDYVHIEVLANDPAIAIKGTKETPYDIQSVRQGKWKDYWLLSTGLLLFNEKTQLAMGKRNQHGIDPGLWTHLIAGRTDTFLEKHLHNEILEELYWYIRVNDNENKWYRLYPDILKNHPDLSMQYMAQSHPFEKIELVPFEYVNPLDIFGVHLSEYKRLVVEWPDRQENIDALVFLDEKHRTVEIRLMGKCYTPPFKESVLLYPEGDDLADWWDMDYLLYLRHKEKRENIKIFVPFMRYFLDIVNQAYSRKSQNYHIL